jgi:hypothetical protein
VHHAEHGAFLFTVTVATSGITDLPLPLHRRGRHWRCDWHASLVVRRGRHGVSYFRVGITMGNTPVLLLHRRGRPRHHDQSVLSLFNTVSGFASKLVIVRTVIVEVRNPKT